MKFKVSLIKCMIQQINYLHHEHFLIKYYFKIHTIPNIALVYYKNPKNAIYFAYTLFKITYKFNTLPKITSDFIECLAFLYNASIQHIASNIHICINFQKLNNNYCTMIKIRFLIY